jgi:hypothetical protein
VVLKEPHRKRKVSFGKALLHPLSFPSPDPNTHRAHPYPCKWDGTDARMKEPGKQKIAL